MAVRAIGLSTGIGRDLWPTSPTDGANWGARDSAFIGVSSTGRIGIMGGAKASLLDNPAAAPIGVAGFVINDGTGSGWAGYFDVQHESTANASSGVEIAVKNKGSNQVPDAYNLVAGAHGLWLSGGGDSAYGGSPANPSAAAITILKNAHTWNAGIVFRSDGLTGTDGTGTGQGIALNMAAGHALEWMASSGNVGARIRSDNVAASADVLQLFGANAVRFYGANSKAILQLVHNAGAVNGLMIQNGAAGAPAKISSAGDDANIDLFLSGQGTGVLKFGAFSALGAEALSGYITIKDSSGNTRKLAVIA